MIKDWVMFKVSWGKWIFLIDIVGYKKDYWRIIVVLRCLVGSVYMYI